MNSSNRTQADLGQAKSHLLPRAAKSPTKMIATTMKRLGRAITKRRPWPSLMRGEAFRAGNYAEAQKLAEAAIKLWPEDVIAHEFRALTLFAQQKYRESAASIYAVLAGGPGWNEQTLMSFYPDRKQYEEQLAALERFVRHDPKAADAEFLLAYHQLTAGHRNAARAELERVAQY